MKIKKNTYDEYDGYDGYDGYDENGDTLSEIKYRETERLNKKKLMQILRVAQTMEISYFIQ